ERLADDEVDAGFDRPLHLLLEHRPDRAARCRIRRIEAVGLADVAGEQCAGFGRDRPRDVQRAAIHRSEVLLAPDHPQLRATRWHEPLAASASEATPPTASRSSLSRALLIVSRAARSQQSLPPQAIFPGSPAR